MVQTVHEVTAAGARHAPAIGAPGRPWLDYAALKKLVDGTIAALNGAGLGRGDRVALVLPNGPEMASAFIAVAAGASAVPLDPDFAEGELARQFAELKPRAVIVQKGAGAAARAAAAKASLPVIDLVPQAQGPAGAFILDVSALPAAKATKSGPARGPEISLVLRTTARSRIVPLSASNLGASARHIGAALALTPRDRCLNVMPLFQVHGLVAAVLASLGAGGSVFCAPGFDPAPFLAWLSEARASWYTGSPLLHQAVLARLGRDSEIGRQANLRFIQSFGAALPPAVMQELENSFGCPVIESYGMTEATYLAANALPPGKRKPGSVGLPAGAKIAIMDEAGKVLPRGTIGEVVVQGPNVTMGYDNDPDANAAAFTEEWFRTGDRGRFDEDGYLFLTGRV